MKRFRLSLLVSLSGAVLAGVILFQVSQDVQNAEAELRYLKKQSISEQETIRVLKAEWAYLNQPDRLEDLSGKYLDMRAPDIDQIKESVDGAPKTATNSVPAVLTAPAGSATISVPRPPVKPSRFQNKGFQDLLDGLTPAAGGAE